MQYCNNLLVNSYTKPKPIITMKPILYPKDILFISMVLITLLVGVLGFFHSQKFEKQQNAKHNNKTEINSLHLGK